MQAHPAACPHGKAHASPRGCPAVRLLPALLALLVLLPGCLSSTDPPAAVPSRPDATTDDASLRPVTQQFTGTVTGTPAKPDVKEFPFRDRKSVV